MYLMQCLSFNGNLNLAPAQPTFTCSICLHSQLTAAQTLPISLCKQVLIDLLLSLLVKLTKRQWVSWIVGACHCHCYFGLIRVHELAERERRCCVSHAMKLNCPLFWWTHSSHITLGSQERLRDTN